MHRKFLLLASLCLLLTVSLLWMKWKRDHPKPTTLDLEARQRLVNDKEASLWSSNSEGAVFVSLQERKEIADHLWMLPGAVSRGGIEGVKISWGWETVTLASSPLNDYYESSIGDLKNDTIIITQYRLHPSTSRFLREWLANHPRIVKRLRLNSIE